MVYIVTVFKSFNYGSILQARMLNRVLNNYGSEVVFLDGKSRSYFEKNKFKNVIRAVLKERNIDKAKFLLNEIAQIIMSWRNLKSTTKITTNDEDTIVLGSDEIWNVARKECRYDVFFGGNCRGKVLSYAPSVNNTSKEQFKKYAATVNIDSYAGISVRDFYSKEVVSGVSDRQVSVVLDPTMLFDYHVYSEGQELQKIEERYIAVYLFEPKLLRSEINAIREFAKEQGYRLISFGKWIDWCDDCIPAVNGNPFLYYRDAEYVITNTFHGTAFAINFEKQFVTFTRNNNKVKELIDMFQLSERDVSNCTSDVLQKVFSRSIDYNAVTSLKHSLRETSIEYLNKSIL